MSKLVDILKFIGSGIMIIFIILFFIFLIFFVLSGSLGILKFGLDYLLS